MTKKDLEMTVKNLERKNEFLLLQLKIIHGLLADTYGKSNETKIRHIAKAEYISEAEAIKEELEYIEKYNLKYNFYNKEMDINDYK